MPRWRIQLTEEHFDLEELPKLFNEPLASVLEEAGNYFLLSTDFEACGSAHAVRERAVRMVASLNGAARLAFGGFRPVGLGPVYEESPQGRSITVAITEGLEVRSKVGAVVVGTSQSPAQPPRAPVTNAWVQLASADPAVQRVLRFLSKKTPTWLDLYKAMEVLEANGGHAVLPQLGISKKELGRFTQTANSMHAIGDHSRHARESLPAPKKSMTFEEASSMIARWVRAWLSSRSA